MSVSKPVLEFWAKSYYPLVPAAAGAALAQVAGRKRSRAQRQDWTKRYAGFGVLLGIGIMLYSRKALGRSMWGAPVQQGEWAGILEDAASDQVDYAKDGRRLSDYRDAKPTQAMLKTPTSMSEAYMQAAYWLAVAAQLEGGPRGASLLTKARLAYAGGQASRFMPYSPEWQISKVTQEAAAAVGDSPVASIRAVRGILLHHGTAASISSAKRTEYDSKFHPVDYVTKSGSEVLSVPGGLVTRAGEKAMPGLNLLRSAAGLDEKPEEKKDEWPIWLVPALWAGGGLIVILGLYWATRAGASAGRPAAPVPTPVAVAV